jgi:hypothetical protein
MAWAPEGAMRGTGNQLKRLLLVPNEGQHEQKGSLIDVWPCLALVGKYIEGRGLKIGGWQVILPPSTARGVWSIVVSR